MTVEDCEILRSYTDKLVRVNTKDGEEIVIKLRLMQDEYQDFICDIISTNRVEKYRMPLESSAYAIRYDDVDSFVLVNQKIG